MNKKKLVFDWWLNTVGGGGYSEEYQAILDRTTALGYTKPSADQQVKQNQLVINLKASGIWDLLDVFYVFATDGDSDFATLNWKNPSTNQATKVNSPTFTADQGFTGNGTTSYLNTGWIPSTHGVNFTSNACDLAIHYRTLQTSATAFDGCRTGGGNDLLMMNPQSAAGTAIVGLNAGISSTIANAAFVGTGLHFFGRDSGTNQFARVNNGSLINDTRAVDARPQASLALCALNQNGMFANFHTRQISMATAGNMGVTNHAAFYTAWNTYLTSL